MKPYHFARVVVKNNIHLYLPALLLMIIAGLIDGFGMTLIIPLFELIKSTGAELNVSNTSGTIMKYILEILRVLHIPNEANSILLFIFIVFCLKAILLIFERSISGVILHRFQRLLREKVFSQVIKAKWGFFINQSTGYIANVLSNEARRAGDAFYYLNTFLVHSISILIYIVLSLAVSIKLTIFAGITGLVLMYALKGFVKRAQVYGEKTSTLNSHLHIHTLETLGGVKYIKSTSTEIFFIDLFNKINKKLAVTGYKLSIIFAILKNSYEPVMVGVLCLIFYLSFSSFNVETSNLVLLGALFYRIYSKLSETQYSYQNLRSNLPGFVMAYKLLEEAYDCEEEMQGIEFTGLKKSIQVNNISFSYDNRKDILKNVTLEIPKGKIVAIVGKTGSGKTTIVDIIIGLLQPRIGEVLIDGNKISDFNLKTWRNHIGYVSQDTLLFNETIYNNISCDDMSLSEEQVKEAAEMAYAHEFIMNFTDGYQTIIGERGLKLSGGQKQRIALARALARKTDILILDEATSALDNESETKIKKAIENLRKEITVIIIAHRLTTIENADLIYVLDNGKIIEKGTRNELMQKKGRFYMLSMMSNNSDDGGKQ